MFRTRTLLALSCALERLEGKLCLLSLVGSDTDELVPVIYL